MGIFETIYLVFSISSLARCGYLVSPIFPLFSSVYFTRSLWSCLPSDSITAALRLVFHSPPQSLLSLALRLVSHSTYLCSYSPSHRSIRHFVVYLGWIINRVFLYHAPRLLVISHLRFLTIATTSRIWAPKGSTWYGTLDTHLFTCYVSPRA